MQGKRLTAISLLLKYCYYFKILSKPWDQSPEIIFWQDKSEKFLIIQSQEMRAKKKSASKKPWFE